MHVYKDVRQLAEWRYGESPPTKSHVNCIARRCANGRIRNAEKVMGKWLVDCTAEWPDVFPEVDEAPAAQLAAVEAPDPYEVMGEMLVQVGKMMKEFADAKRKCGAA